MQKFTPPDTLSEVITLMRDAHIRYDGSEHAQVVSQYIHKRYFNKCLQNDIKRIEKMTKQDLLNATTNALLGLPESKPRKPVWGDIETKTIKVELCLTLDVEMRVSGKHIPATHDEPEEKPEYRFVSVKLGGVNILRGLSESDLEHIEERFAEEI